MNSRRLTRRLRELRADAPPPGGPVFTLRPALCRSYPCRTCGVWHREDRDPALYRDHCCFQAGTATAAVPVPIGGDS